MLSLLCDAEPQHQTISNIIRAWHQLHGRIHVSEDVLYETAYHAWISESEYQEITRELTNISDAEARYAIANAFVRAFRDLSLGNYGKRRWGEFIGQFRGTRESDYRNVWIQLQDEGISRLSNEDHDPKVAEAIRDHLVKLREQKLNEPAPKQAIDKAARDGRLLAMLMRLREEKAMGSGGTAVVVSSSWRLSQVCNSFGQHFHGEVPVMSIGALGYLLTLIPGAKMHVGTLQKILFDVGFRTKLASVDRLARVNAILS